MVKVNKNLDIILVVSLILLVSIFLFFYLSFSKNSSSPKRDLFSGVITNIETSPGNLSGIGVYDRTCKRIGNGLTRCDAGIKTKEYGVLNFNYIHDMAVKPCIVSGDKLKVEILDSNGTADVRRIA